MRETLPQLAGPLAPLGAALARGIDDLERALAFILAKHGAEPAVAAAGATPFLQLFGTVAGGWFIGRLAFAAPKDMIAVGLP